MSPQLKRRKQRQSKLPAALQLCPPALQVLLHPSLVDVQHHLRCLLSHDPLHRPLLQPMHPGPKVLSRMMSCRDLAQSNPWRRLGARSPRRLELRRPCLLWPLPLPPCLHRRGCPRRPNSVMTIRHRRRHRAGGLAGSRHLSQEQRHHRHHKIGPRLHPLLAACLEPRFPLTVRGRPKGQLPYQRMIMMGKSRSMKETTTQILLLQCRTKTH